MNASSVLRWKWWPVVVAALVLLSAACGSRSPAVREADPPPGVPAPAAADQPAQPDVTPEPEARPAVSPTAAPAAAATVAPAPQAALEAPAAATPSAALRAAPSLDLIRQAYREITSRLFREIAPRDLLAPAWQAIATEARRQGVSGAEVRAFEARGSDDIDGFAREFTGYVEAAGPAFNVSPAGTAAVRAMASAVGDSHTRFLTPTQADDQRRAADGDPTYSGIGIRTIESGGGYTITEVFPNTPAERAGLRAGDQIVRINGRELDELDPRDIGAHVRGPEGTEIQLTIQRTGEDLRDITLNRARIAIPYVTSSMPDAGIGYIKITSFPRKSGTTDAARDLDEQLARLIAQGARAIVLDLRGNPGGDPFTSVAVASNFVPDGPIFISVNRDGRRTIYSATVRPTVFRGPVAVLVDRGSASGAEVVASALQEAGTGHLIGTRTCGCLSVGRPLQLGDSSGLIVTVEQALTGRQEKSLEATGLEPDQLINTTPRSRDDVQLNSAVAYLRSQLR